MCTDFIVFNDHKFAHRIIKSDNYVCYRTVICHALFWKMNHTTPENAITEAVNAFNDFANAVNNSLEHEDNTFLSLFICPMRNQTGYIIVDKSRGYYPLVAYPFTNKMGASRAEALRFAVSDLSDHLTEIINTLNNELINRRDWSPDLQQRLQDTQFHYLEDNVSNNIEEEDEDK